MLRVAWLDTHDALSIHTWLITHDSTCDEVKRVMSRQIPNVTSDMTQCTWCIVSTHDALHIDTCDEVKRVISRKNPNVTRDMTRYIWRLHMCDTVSVFSVQKKRIHPTSQYFARPCWVKMIQPFRFTILNLKMKLSKINANHTGQYRVGPWWVKKSEWTVEGEYMERVSKSIHSSRFTIL